MSCVALLVCSVSLLPHSPNHTCYLFPFPFLICLLTSSSPRHIGSCRCSGSENRTWHALGEQSCTVHSPGITLSSAPCSRPTDNRWVDRGTRVQATSGFSAYQEPENVSRDRGGGLEGRLLPSPSETFELFLESSKLCLRVPAMELKSVCVAIAYTQLSHSPHLIAFEKNRREVFRGSGSTPRMQVGFPEGPSKLVRTGWPRGLVFFRL